MPTKNNATQVSKAFSELSSEIKKIPDLAFDYMGDVAVREMQRRAPVDKGNLKRGIRKTKSSRGRVTITSEALYSAPVDKGHKTRQGTGRAENYKPKPGGKTFVTANPYFSSVVKEMPAVLSKQAQTLLNGKLRIAFSKVRG